MPDSNISSLVSTNWLAEHIDAPDVRVVDASYYLPHEGLNPRAEYEDQHIPGAVFFDIDEIADTSNSLPHMLPPPEKFASRVRRLGLGDGNRIVVYDQRGIMSAPRVWWTFKSFGHNDVAVLDGGLPKWRHEGRPLSDAPPAPAERHFTPRFNTFMVREKDQLMSNLKSQREQVLDARSEGRFAGTAPEPREGLRSGHIPQSLNLPFTHLIDPTTQTYKPLDELKSLLSKAGVDPKQPVVTTCGSGITAAVLALALELTGHRDYSVYDGSWSEWGLAGDTPVDT